MLKLNNPIYQTTSAYGHFGRKPTDKVNFLGKKRIKLIYLNCNLEKTLILFYKLLKIIEIQNGHQPIFFRSYKKC